MTNEQLEKLLKEAESANSQIMWNAFRNDTCAFCGNTEEFMTAVTSSVKELLAARELVEGLEKMGSIQDFMPNQKIRAKSEDSVNAWWRKQRDQLLSNYRKAVAG